MNTARAAQFLFTCETGCAILSIVKKRDWYIIAAVLALALAAFILRRAFQPEAPAYVTVYVGDTVYASVPIDAYQTITVDQGDGKVNVIVIDASGVRMESSTCKNQLCVLQGTIDPARRDELLLGNRVICLPNGVTVALTDAKE